MPGIAPGSAVAPPAAAPPGPDEESESDPDTAEMEDTDA